MKKYELIFGDTILKKLKKIESEKDIKKRVSKMLDKIEEKGPKSGKLLDSIVNLYEIKSKKPPLRLYFEIIFDGNKAEIIDFEMKKNPENQNKLIAKIINYLKNKN